jgi:hypothetical protein
VPGAKTELNLDNAKVYARLGGTLYHSNIRCPLVTSAITGELYMPIDVTEALRRELVPCTVCLGGHHRDVKATRKEMREA